MKNFERTLAFGMLVFAIIFNLWTYRLEPTATTDPNDNTFQFALVDRTNQIWDFATKKCSVNIICSTSYLIDHWVPNWTEGYNLPFYYSHVPQIIIVATYRILHINISLFTYYHWIIYLLLSLFPISLFLALRVLRLSWLTAGIGALLATHLSTDGLYGLDPSSFLWRGYGLSSQLFAMIWLPLAIAASIRYLRDSSHFALAVLALVFTSMGHLGIGIIALLSLIPLSFPKPNSRVLFLLGATIFFLSYWVLPIVTNDNYHNISFWDPVWKFNSYGWNETIVRLFNGDLFDFGRFPWLTILIFIGLFASYRPLSILFIFWLLLYFGRTTWGGLVDLIPGMKEFHLSRFIVGLHVAGMFLAPIGVDWLVSRITYYVSRIRLPARHRYLPDSASHWQAGAQALAGGFVFLFISLLIYLAVYPQTIRYSTYNDTLIKQGNENALFIQKDVDELLGTLKGLPPGRVFFGRGGSWGRDFRVAETPFYMQMSTYGIPTVLWLPETWSPNADTEQYFSEDKPQDYDLYNIRYVAAPPTQKAFDFWKLLKETPTWKLYTITPDVKDVRTSGVYGYFTSGVRPAIVSTDKKSFVNVVRLWIQSDNPKQGLYPELTFDTGFPRDYGLPNFKMIDEVTYQVPDGSTHNLFAERPVYEANTGKITIENENVDSDMIFSARVDVPKDCIECLVILKQTFHPNWRATIDGKPVSPITVFPFYLAVPVTEGQHEIVFSYQPSTLKVFLLIFELIAISALVLYRIIGKHVSDNSFQSHTKRN